MSSKRTAFKEREKLKHKKPLPRPAPKAPLVRKAKPAPRQAAAPAARSREPRLSQKDIDLLKRTVAKGVSDDEFALFLWVCKKHKLDPLTRQIYCVRRFLQKHHQDEKGIWHSGYQMTIQMGVDGIRSLAARDHRDFGGCDEPEFEFAKAGDKIPTKATVRLRKKGLAEWPVVGVCYWDEFAPVNMESDAAFFWRRMPKHMLAKCAEAQAIRKGYPELADIYATEEMARADSDDFTPEGRRIEEPQGPTAGEQIAQRKIAEHASQQKTLEAKPVPRSVTVWFAADKKTMYLSGAWQDIAVQLRANGAKYEDARERWRIPIVACKDVYEDLGEAKITVIEGPQEPSEELMGSTTVDPDASRCPECAGSFGVHLTKCSKFTPHPDGRSGQKPNPPQGAPQGSMATPPAQIPPYEPTGAAATQEHHEESVELVSEGVIDAVYTHTAGGALLQSNNAAKSRFVNIVVGGTLFTCFHNSLLKIDERTAKKFFDLIGQQQTGGIFSAVGKVMRFRYKTSASGYHNIQKILRLGALEWDEEGNPAVQRNQQ